MAHIVLLGDSIFDNKAYIGNEPDVISHLQGIIPSNWQAALNAVDGSLVENVSGQLLKSPPDATHFVISVGGNNAIMNADVLGLKVSSAAEVFNNLSDRISTFEFHYREMLKTVLSRNLPTTVCTIYYPNFPEPNFQKLSTTALSSFNDVIIKQAISFGIPLLDLRLICNEKDDYANEIEPSSKGGRKIAAKILEVINNHDFAIKQTRVYC
ncbi:MAG: SGNH/GDSL hydrolase family protein [Pyrinomonadaceae bacterium]|nr:SGNH/GDSL hydrolase family protein [Pyrinomonadaceae bacterium]